MREKHVHASHPGGVMRLEQTHGHLRNGIGMIRREQTCIECIECIECIDIARPLHAAERTVRAGKKPVTNDRLDDCLAGVAGALFASMPSSVAKFKDISKYL